MVGYSQRIFRKSVAFVTLAAFVAVSSIGPAWASLGDSVMEDFEDSTKTYITGTVIPNGLPGDVITQVPVPVARPSTGTDAGTSGGASSPTVAFGGGSFLPPSTGGVDIGGIMDQVKSAAGGLGGFMDIFANSIGAVLAATGGGGGFDFGAILSSLFGSVLEGNLSDFGAAGASFSAAAGSNGIFESLASGAGLSSMVPSLADYLSGSSGVGQVTNMNDTDMDCLTKVICSEARGEIMMGKIGVGHVVLNRMKKRGLSACGVIYQKSQFEGINSYNINRESSQVQAECKEAAVAVLNGTPDPTGGADHFLALKVLAGRGQAVPSWAGKMARVVDIDNHTFYRSA